jgi:quinol monooxygenase YgiN
MDACRNGMEANNPVMIQVIATILLQAGQREPFLTELRQLVHLVRQEAGCIEYEPNVDAPTKISGQSLVGENTVVLVEKWENVPALEAHLKSPHIATFLEKSKPWVAGLELAILQPA